MSGAPMAPASCMSFSSAPEARQFFAASRPNTALDMINRLPGFQLDSGNSARGFAGRFPTTSIASS